MIIGYVVKIKKILESVCHNCGLILADYVSLPCEDALLRSRNVRADCNI
jgi:hypothetical protein